MWSKGCSGGFLFIYLSEPSDLRYLYMVCFKLPFFLPSLTKEDTSFLGSLALSLDLVLTTIWPNSLEVRSPKPALALHVHSHMYLQTHLYRALCMKGPDGGICSQVAPF